MDLDFTEYSCGDERPQTNFICFRLPNSFIAQSYLGKVQQDFKHVFVIGGSAGSIAELYEILPFLPRVFSCPILITLHISNSSLKGFINAIIKKGCKLNIRIAEDKMVLQENTIYFCPEGKSMEISSNNLNYYITLTDKFFKFGNTYFQSIDALFNSAAKTFKGKVVGITLSGLGIGSKIDGVFSLESILINGGHTISHSNQSGFSIMPRKAWKLGLSEYNLTSKGILKAMIGLC